MSTKTTTVLALVAGFIGDARRTKLTIENLVIDKVNKTPTRD